MTSSRSISRIAVLATATLVVLLGGGAATAAWTKLGTGSGAVASTSLVTPNVSATKSSTAPTTAVDVTWTAPSQLGGVTYAVTRNGAAWAACTSSPCSDTGLAPGTSYTYVVTANLNNWTKTGTGSATTDAAAAAARPTTTGVTSSQNPVKSNSNVTFTAIVAPQTGTGVPTGTVTFKDGANSIACTGGSQALNAGTATCQTNFASFGAPRSITAVYAGDSTFLTSTSTALSQRVVNGGVTGLRFANVLVGSASPTPTCTGLGTSNVSCTVSGGSNNAVVKADVMFVSSLGNAAIYATDAATAVDWSATGKGNPLSGSLSLAANASTSTTQNATATRNGSNHATITYTFTDAGTTFTATLTTN